MAKVFLGLDDAYRVLSEGTTLYGVAGDPTDRVLIESDARGISVNANMDRLDFNGNLADFTFKSGFGANMQVYAADGTTLLANISLQDDADGTQLVFADGAVDAIYNAGAIGVGGVNITGTAGGISPAASGIDTGVTTGAGVSVNAPLLAKVFLESGDTYRELNDHTTIYGVAGDSSDKLIIEAGAQDLSVNANMDRLDFNGDISNFKFKSGFGANMQVYAADGTTLIATVPLQDDADGTQLVFGNGAVDAIYNAGAIGVGGVTLTSTASAISPDSSNIDTSVTTGGGATTINVSGSNNGETYTALDSSTETFIIDNTSSYEYSITGFNLGVDVLQMPAGTTMDNTALDGKARLYWTSTEGVIVGVTLEGLTNAEDTQLTQASNMGASLVTGGAAPTGETVSADIGAINSPATLDASGKSYIFTDDANVVNRVVINGFSTDDVINVSNASEGDYFFTNEGADVRITYNNTGGVINEIQLVGVVTANDLVYNEASFETAIGFDAFSFV